MTSSQDAALTTPTPYAWLCFLQVGAIWLHKRRFYRRLGCVFFARCLLSYKTYSMKMVLQLIILPRLPYKQELPVIELIELNFL